MPPTPGGDPADSGATPNFKLEALRLYDQGLSVIPLRPAAKRPVYNQWEQFSANRAPRDMVEEWWDDHPEANIGIVTGPASGVLVLDVDGPLGAESLEGRSLPITPRTKTRNGWHYFFVYPEKHAPIKNRVGILPGVDIRADGGQVVAPPSLHPDGGQYEWFDSPWDTEFAEPPGWLLDKMVEDGVTGEAAKNKPKPGRGEFGTLWEEALYLGVGEGRRNDALASLAGHYFSLGLPEHEVLALVLNTNDAKFRPPVDDAEVEQVVMSIGRSEQSQQWTAAATRADDGDTPAPPVKLPAGEPDNGERERALAREAASQALGCRIEYAIKYDTSPPSFKLGVESHAVILERVTCVTKESLFRDSFANGVGRLPQRIGNKRWDKIANALLASFEVQHVEEATDVGMLTGMLRDYLTDYPPTDEIAVGTIDSSHPLAMNGDILINLNHLRVWAKTGWHVTYTINELGTLLKQQQFEPQQVSRREANRRATRNYWTVPQDFLDDDGGDEDQPPLEGEALLKDAFPGRRLN